MAYITPDLGLLFGYGPSSGPTPDAYDQQPTDPNDLLATLLAQHMTRGLDTNPQNIGGHQGQPMFSGPVGGYAGPLRQSDIPQSRIATTMKPEEASALDLARGTQFPGMGPGADLERIAAIMGSIKGLHEDAQNALLTKMGFGDIADSKLNKEKDLATFRYGLGASDRASAEADRKARLLATLQALKERQMQFDLTRRVPLGDAEKRLAEFYAASADNRSPEKLAAEAQRMGYSYLGGVSDRTMLPAGYDSPNFKPRLGPMTATRDPLQDMIMQQLQSNPNATPAAPSKAGGTASAPQVPVDQGKSTASKPGLSREQKSAFLKAAGNDIAKAKKMAADAGFDPEK